MSGCWRFERDTKTDISQQKRETLYGASSFLSLQKERTAQQPIMDRNLLCSTKCKYICRDDLEINLDEC